MTSAGGIPVRPTRRRRSDHEYPAHVDVARRRCRTRRIDRRRRPGQVRPLGGGARTLARDRTRPAARSRRWPRTLEVLDARGLADDVLAHAHRASGVSIFAGARIDLTHLRSAYRFVAVTPQTNVDRALAEYAANAGRRHPARLRSRCTRAGFRWRDGHRAAEGRRRSAAHAGHGAPHYVIGADGAHSTVRDLLGADFAGKTILSSVVLADVKLADGPTSGELTLGSTRDVIGFLAPYDRGDEDGAWYRAMVWDRKHQVPDSEPASPDEVIDVLTRAMGRDVGVLEIGWLSRFHCDERQVAQYRYGRVFLAGDAAHVHSPMGGQGMNTGIQDAANLAWKLDAVLGGAPEEVLDTYQSERHPIGSRVLRQSGMMARGVTLHPRIARAMRNLLAPRLLRRATDSRCCRGQLRGYRIALPPSARRAPTRRHEGDGDSAPRGPVDAPSAVRGIRVHPRTRRGARRRARTRRGRTHRRWPGSPGSARRLHCLGGAVFRPGSMTAALARWTGYQFSGRVTAATTAAMTTSTTMVRATAPHPCPS